MFHLLPTVAMCDVDKVCLVVTTPFSDDGAIL